VKARWAFIICGSLAALVASVSVQLLRPARSHQSNYVAISSLGYTIQSNACMALFQVTNRTAAALWCFVGPRCSEAGRGGRLLVHDLYAAAPPGTLPPRGTFTFAVAAAPDANNWRVSVEVQELRAARSVWQTKLTPVLRHLGICLLEDKQYYFTSSAFSRPPS
jgi:hypothetical protein